MFRDYKDLKDREEFPDFQVVKAKRENRRILASTTKVKKENLEETALQDHPVLPVKPGHLDRLV